MDLFAQMFGVHRKLRQAIRPSPKIEKNVHPIPQQSWDVFISHCQMESGETCKSIALRLKHEFNTSVWFDMDVTNRGVEGMVHGVKQSDNFVLYMTKSYFSRPFCKKELDMAIEAGKNIVVLFQTNTRFGGYPTAGEFFRHIPQEYNFLRDSVWIDHHRDNRMESTCLERLLELCVNLHRRRPNHLLRSRLTQHQLSDYIPGTREWLFSDIDQWYQAKDHPGMLLVGHAGVGKSMISSELCKRGDTSDASIPVAAYHFFQHDDSRLNDAKTCVLSIHEQLKGSMPQFKEVCRVEQVTRDGKDGLLLLDLFTQFIVEPCQLMPETTASVVIVLDALDECKDANMLTEILASRWEEMPTWIRLFVTSRPEQSIPEQLGRFRVCELTPRDPRNLQDVKVYIKHKLQPIMAPENLEDGVDVMLKHSEGMFLYAKLVDELLAERSEASGSVTIQQLQELPIGKSGVFAKYFKRLYNSLDNNADLYHALLFPILAARTPIPKWILMRLNGFNPVDEEDELVKERLHKFSQLFQPCQSLIEHDKKGFSGTMRFIHKSMVDWLTGTDPNQQNAVSSGCPNLHIDVSSGDNASVKDMAQVLLELFRDPLPEVEGVPNTEVEKINSFATRQCFYHSCLARDYENAKMLLFDFDLLLRRIRSDSTHRVISDASKYLMKGTKRALERRGHHEEITLMVKFLRLSKSALDYDPRMLAQEVIKRFHGVFSRSPILTTLVNSAEEYLTKHRHFKPKRGVHGATVEGPLLQAIEVGSTVRAVTYSSDGALVVCGFEDATVRVWNANTGEPWQALTGCTGMLNAVAVCGSSDCLSVVAGSGDCTVSLWNDMSESTKVTMQRLSGHEGSVNAVAFSPNTGAALASASSDMTVRLWQRDTCKCLHVLHGHEGNVTSVAFSSDQRLVASGSQDCTVRVWDAVAGGSALMRLVGHSDIVTSVCYSPNGEMIASGSVDSTIQLWEAKTGTKLGPAIVGHEDSVLSVEFSPDGSKVVSYSDDDSVCIWEVGPGKAARLHADPFIPRTGHRSAVVAVDVSPTGDSFVSGSKDGTVRLWEFPPSASHASVLETDDFLHVALSPRDDCIATSSGRSIKLWCATTGVQLIDGKSLEYHHASITALAFSPNGKLIVSGSDDETIIIWDVKTGNMITEKPLEVRSVVESVSFCPSGKTVVSGSGGRIELWNFKKGREKVRWKPLKSTCDELDGMQSIAISKDRQLVAYAIGSKLHVVDVKTADTTELDAHSSHVKSIKFEGNGKLVSQSSRERLVFNVSTSGASPPVVKNAKDEANNTWFPELKNGIICVKDNKDVIPYSVNGLGVTLDRVVGYLNQEGERMLVFVTDTNELEFMEVKK